MNSFVFAPTAASIRIYKYISGTKHSTCASIVAIAASHTIHAYA